ncbi:MAG: hypothetical protein NVS4B8_24590 [Herpetosiphon sp.]
MPRADSSVIVDAPVADVYQRWTQFDRFPEFMNNIKSVSKKEGDKVSHWVVKGPLGIGVEFDAEMTTNEPNKRIAWNSRDNGQVKTSGQVTFTELGTGQTQVHVILNYDPPAGVAGDVIAKLFSNPQQELEEDLGRFKTQINRSSSNPQSTGQSSGKGDSVKQ